MPSDDYTSAVGGGLKLKGGISKGKKKKKAKKDPEKDDSATTPAEKPPQNEDIAPIEEKDAEEVADTKEEPEDDEDRKTEAEKKYEEMRRKRVGFSFIVVLRPLSLSPPRLSYDFILKLTAFSSAP